MNHMNEQEKQLFEEVKRLLNEGCTYDEIAVFLNGQGSKTKTGLPWTGKRVGMQKYHWNKRGFSRDEKTGKKTPKHVSRQNPGNVSDRFDYRKATLEMQRLKDEGFSERERAEKLNEAGLLSPTGKKWHWKNAANFLRDNRWRILHPVKPDPVKPDPVKPRPKKVQPDIGQIDNTSGKIAKVQTVTPTAVIHPVPETTTQHSNGYKGEDTIKPDVDVSIFYEIVDPLQYKTGEDMQWCMKANMDHMESSMSKHIAARIQQGYRLESITNIPPTHVPGTIERGLITQVLVTMIKN